MEGVGTAMGMPIPLLPLFSLLLLPPLLPLREERDRRERGHQVFFYSGQPVQTAQQVTLQIYRRCDARVLFSKCLSIFSLLLLLLLVRTEPQSDTPR